MSNKAENTSQPDCTRCKVSIRFFNDREVRAVWDDEAAKWWFCVVDVVAALEVSMDPGNYWYVFKNRLKKTGDELLTDCKGFKLLARDGKRRVMDCLDSEGIVALAKKLPSPKASGFLDWFLYSDTTIDGQSKKWKRENVKTKTKSVPRA